MANLTAPVFRLRYKPETFLMVSPCMVPPLICARLFVDHCMRRRNLRFQALYLRIAVLFPFMSASLTMGYFFPEYTLWLDLVAGITESYIIICFYALMTSWAWSRGVDVKEALWKGSLTKGPFVLPYISCNACYVFRSKQSCFRFQTLSVYQLIFTRAAMELVVPTYMTISQGISKTDSTALDVPRPLAIGVAMLKPVPLVWTMKTVLVCYLTLKRTEPSSLQGLNAVRKFLLIKLVFYFFILNRLIQTLVDPRPLFCREETSQLAQWVCKIRFRYWVGLLQVAILSLLLPRWFGTLDFKETASSEEKATFASTPAFSIPHLIVRVFSFGDINRLYVYPPPTYRTAQVTPSISKNATDTDTNRNSEDNTKVVPLPVQLS